MTKARWTTTSASATSASTACRSRMSPGRHSAFSQPNALGVEGAPRHPDHPVDLGRPLQRRHEGLSQLPGRSGDGDGQHRAHSRRRGGAGASSRTLNFFTAGVGSVLPAASIARTLKTCLPGFSPLYFFGERQVLNGLRSSLHWKVEPASVEVNLNFAVRRLELRLRALGDLGLRRRCVRGICRAAAATAFSFFFRFFGRPARSSAPARRSRRWCWSEARRYWSPREGSAGLHSGPRRQFPGAAAVGRRPADERFDFARRGVFLRNTRTDAPGRRRAADRRRRRRGDRRRLDPVVGALGCPGVGATEVDERADVVDAVVAGDLVVAVFEVRDFDRRASAFGDRVLFAERAADQVPGRRKFAFVDSVSGS